MFVGHLALGLAAKRVAPGVNLGSVQALGWFALIGWVVVSWAARADRDSRVT